MAHVWLMMGYCKLSPREGKVLIIHHFNFQLFNLGTILEILFTSHTLHTVSNLYQRLIRVAVGLQGTEGVEELCTVE